MAHVYIIRNTINDKVYIGQTNRDIKSRWLAHLSRGRHAEKYKYSLYNAMNKYGLENFYIEDLEECSEAELDEREQYWIAYYNSYYNGYNDTLGGQKDRKSCHYEEICDYLLSGYTKEEAAEHFKCNPKTIYNACKSILGKNPLEIMTEVKEQKILDCYTSDKTIEQIVEESGCAKERVMKTLRRYDLLKIKKEYTGMSKPIIQYDLEGNIVAEFPSLEEASAKTGINKNSIMLSMKNDNFNFKNPKHNQYKWRYK